jgi:hypothetical protein
MSGKISNIGSSKKDNTDISPKMELNNSNNQLTKNKSVSLNNKGKTLKSIKSLHQLDSESSILSDPES